MALRQVKPLAKEQWKFVERKLKSGPSDEQKNIVRKLTLKGKKIKSVSRKKMSA